MNLALHLSNVIGKLNKLNLQLQGRDKHLPHLADNITAFIRKLEVWGRHLDQGNTDAFENLSEIAETSTSGATTVIPCFKQHISTLTELFKKYIPNNSVQYDWIIDQFNTAGWYFNFIDCFFFIIVIYCTFICNVCYLKRLLSNLFIFYLQHLQISALQKRTNSLR